VCVCVCILYKLGIEQRFANTPTHQHTNTRHYKENMQLVTKSTTGVGNTDSETGQHPNRVTPVAEQAILPNVELFVYKTYVLMVGLGVSI